MNPAKGTFTTAVFEYSDRTETHTMVWRGTGWYTLRSLTPMDEANRITLANGTVIKNRHGMAHVVKGPTS